MENGVQCVMTCLDVRMLTWHVDSLATTRLATMDLFMTWGMWHGKSSLLNMQG